MNNKNIIIGIVIIFFLGGTFWLLGGKDTSSGLTPEKEITHGHGLAVDIADSNKLYIATHHGLLMLINEKDLYRVGKSKDDYMGFSVHLSDPKTFFSSGHPATGGNVGFQKSEDGGNTWKKISNGLDGPVDFHAMSVSPVNPNLVYGWYRGNLQRSEDGGKSWVKFSTSVPLVALAGDTKDEHIVYAASPQGLYKSQNKGETWEKLVEGFVAAIAVHPADSQKLLISSEQLGLAQSRDSGKTWQSTNQSFVGESALFIAFNPQTPEIVYLLTEKNSLYKSQDGASIWSQIR